MSDIPTSTPPSDLPAVNRLFQQNAARVDNFVNGPDDGSYTTTDGREVPTVAAVVAQINAVDAIARTQAAATQAAADADRAENAADLSSSSSRTVWRSTLADLTAAMASQPADTPGVVTDGADQGFYSWDGTTLHRTDLQPASIQRVSAVEGDVGVLQGVSPVLVQSEDLLEASVDQSGFMTWLSSRQSDGGPTTYSENMLRDRLGLLAVSNDEYLWALTDTNSVLTSLAILRETGDFADFVYERIAARVSGGISNSAPTILTNQYIRDDAALPLKTDMTRWSVWGSSSASYFTPFAQSLAAEYGVTTVYAGGQGAEWGEQTAARQGGVRGVVTAASTIPASGMVVLPTSIPAGGGGMKAYTCTIAGVSGTGVMVGGVFQFTRSSAGSAVSVPQGTDIIPTDGEAYRNAVQLQWIGKNSISGGESAGEVIELLDACFDWLSPMYKNSIMIGQFIDRDEPAVSTARSTIMTVNAWLANRYGNQYLDVYGLLTGSQLWIITGITPTQADLDAQALGNKPPSVSLDNLHLNDAGNSAVQYILRQKINALGWYA